jgi:hypothetical protein
MMLVDNSILGDLGEYTGFDILFLRNSRSLAMSIMPRQFRALNSTMDSTGDTYYYNPLYIRGPWATRTIELFNTIVKRSDGTPVTITAGNPPPIATLGTNASWSGDRLIIPNSGTDPFLQWVAAAWEGAIVYAGNNPGFTSYGVITMISAPSDASALYLDVTWLAGTRPATGQLAMSYVHEMVADLSSSYQGSARWEDTTAMKQVVPSTIASGVNRDFPTNYPAAQHGFLSGASPPPVSRRR